MRQDLLPESENDPVEPRTPDPDPETDPEPRTHQDRRTLTCEPLPETLFYNIIQLVAY